MAKQRRRTTRQQKPTLIKCGIHYIAPADIRCISMVKKNLYVIKFFSDPNPQYPCWVEDKDIASLLDQFAIIAQDEGGE